MKKISAAVSACVAFGFSAFNVQAESNLDLTLGVGSEYHDNALRVETDKRSDYAWVGRGSVAYQNTDPFTPIDLSYLVEDRNFVHDREEDETLVNGASNFMWRVFPRNLEFQLANEASSQLIDRRGANVTSNREQRSVTRAGLNAYANISPVDRLVFSPGFTDVNVSGETGVDSQRKIAGVGWDHRVDAVSTLSLMVSRSAVDSQDSINDYDLDTAMLTYAAQLSRLQYSLGAGSNRIDRDSSDQRINGAVFRLTADYDAGDFSWGASYVQQLTDSGTGLAEVGQTAFEGGDGNVGEFDILESRQAELHATIRTSESGSLQASVSHLKYDYDETLRDEKDIAATVRYYYNVNTYWRLGVGASARKADFIDDPADLVQKDKIVDVTADYRMTERLGLHATVGREERDLSSPAGDYVDVYALLHIDYQIY